MEKIKAKHGFTMTELMVCLVLVTMLLGYAWKFYFGGRETMRHTVSQSQVQADTRIFLDKLENRMASCYEFNEIDSEKNDFSFYSFVYSRTPLDDVLYDSSGNPHKTDNTSNQRIKVVRYQFTLREDGTVVENRMPGWLFFLQKPMRFVKGNPEHYLPTESEVKNKVVLRNIAEFNIKGYKQSSDKSESSGIKIEPVKKENSKDAAFIILRIHTKKEEGRNRRDEELDIVTRFYCQTKLAELANPGHFCTTDSDGTF